MSYDFVKEGGVFKLFSVSCRSVAIAICESAHQAERVKQALIFEEDVEDLLEANKITLEDIEKFASLNVDILFKIG